MGKKRVGNRTNHRPESAEHIGKLNAAFAQELAGYREFAAARRNRRKYTQEGMTDMYTRVCEYAQECERAHAPMTIAGVQMALNTNKDFWSKAQAGEYDFLLEEYLALHNLTEDDFTYIDGEPWHVYTDADTGECAQVMLIPFSDFVQKVRLILQDQLERNLYTNKGNPAGSIFSLKAQFDWQEDHAPQHLVQQLVIADNDQARKAIELLTNVEK